MSIPLASRTAFALLAVSFVVGCAASGTLDGAGGTLESADGGLRLTLPTGALTSEVEVTIDHDDGTHPSSAVTPAYRIEPTDTTLAVPGTVWMAVDEAARGTATIARLEGLELFPLPSLPAPGGVEAAIDRFGTYVTLGGTDEDGDGVSTPADCDDTDSTVHPDHPEVRGDGLDNDCDGVVDEWCETDAALAANGYPSICPEFEDYDASGGAGAEGTSMPGFVLVDQNGVELDFRQLLGGVVLLDLAAAWCGPCKVYSSESQALHDAMQALGPSHLVTVMVQEDTGANATPALATEWATTYGLDHPVLADEDSAYTALFGIDGFPTSFLIAPDGTVVERFAGLPSDTILDDVQGVFDTYEADVRP